MERDETHRHAGGHSEFGMDGMEGRSYGAPEFNPTSGDRFGDTRDLHHGVAETQRRWAGPGGAFLGTDAEITHGHGRTAPFTGAELEARIAREAERQATLQGSMLRPNNVRTLLSNRANYTELNTVYTSILNEAVAATDFTDQNMMIDRRGAELVHPMETAFIRDPAYSSIDLLPPDRAAHYRGIAWERLDYPGHAPGEATGRHEHQAIAMRNELNAIRPQRRPNSTGDAVITQSEFDRSAALRRYVDAELSPINAFTTPLPGETTAPVQPRGHRLNRHAAEAYHRMRDAAQADGVALIIGDSFRSRATAQANAAASGNPSAVGAFSSHTLGLAFDLNLSYAGQTFQETTTRPFTNVMDMRTSPGHKWMFMHGAQYGFFPLQDEPWHYEYNPVGFRDQFMEEFRASTAPRP
jgi:D-alanyl-D-alanine carboxypeptidase